MLLDFLPMGRSAVTLRDSATLRASGLILAACLVVTGTAAHADRALHLTIEDAIARAERASPRVREARAVLDRSRAQVRAAWGAWLPQVDASASYVRTIKSEFEDIFDTPVEGP